MTDARPIRIRRVTAQVAFFLLLGAVVNWAITWGLVCWTPPILAIQSTTSSWPVEVSTEWPGATTESTAQHFGFLFVRVYGDNRDQVRAARDGAFSKVEEIRRENSERLAENIRFQARGYELLTKEQREEYLEELREFKRTYEAALNQYTTELRSQVYKLGEIDLFRTGWPMLNATSERRYSGSSPGGNFIDTKTGLDIPKWIPFCDHEQRDTRRLPTTIIPLGFAVNTSFYAGVCALLAFGVQSLRERYRTKVGCCVVCNYDLRGAEHAACPECGTPIKKVAE